MVVSHVVYLLFLFAGVGNARDCNTVFTKHLHLLRLVWHKL